MKKTCLPSTGMAISTVISRSDALTWLSRRVEIWATGVIVMSKTVEIYIGFMEEEISPQLKTLVAKYKGKIPVRAISRGALARESQLFEQDMSYYGVNTAYVEYFVAQENATGLTDGVA